MTGRHGQARAVKRVRTPSTLNAQASGEESATCCATALFDMPTPVIDDSADYAARIQSTSRIR